MTHPDVDGVAEATAEAFQLVYRTKGWVLAAAPAEAQPAGPAATPDPGPQPPAPVTDAPTDPTTDPTTPQE